MRKDRTRHKCVDCPALTTQVYCLWCARARGRAAMLLTMPPDPTIADLFAGSREAERRRRAVLDAIDLAALIDREGWINFLAWADRAGYEVNLTRRCHRSADDVKSAAARQWERLKQRLREHGLEVETRAAADYSPSGGGQPGTEDAFTRTAIRFTVDGWDRLAALTTALDDWLCSKREEVK